MIVLITRGLYLFLFCYFGQLTSDSYSKMNDSLYASNWQRFPVKLQNYFILFIEYAQMEIVYDGFGIAVLSYATFLKV